MSSKPYSVLLVEDSPTQRLSIRVLLKKAGYVVHEVTDGLQALEFLKSNQTTIVLTDLQMPKLDGLQLVKRIGQQFPSLPVVLITGEGSEEVAVRALRHGAASYVSKKDTVRNLLDTLDRVLNASLREHRFSDLLQRVDACRYSFVLENDRALVVSCVQYMQTLVDRHCFQDEGELRQFGVAIEEALLHALYHGNLELGSDVHELDEPEKSARVRERSEQSTFGHRKIYASIECTADQVTVTVRDEGVGFEQDRFTAMDDGEKDRSFVANEALRGPLLIKTFMDSVTFNASGHEITMTKQCQRGPSNTETVEFSPINL